MHSTDSLEWIYREKTTQTWFRTVLWFVFKEKNLGSLFVIEGGNMPEGRKLRQREEREKEGGNLLGILMGMRA